SSIGSYFCRSHADPARLGRLPPRDPAARAAIGSSRRIAAAAASPHPPPGDEPPPGEGTKRVMRNFFTVPLAGLVARIALLAVITKGTGLDAAGWIAGAGYGVTAAALLARSLVRHPRSFGPADWVTWVRAVLVGAVTALVVESFVGGISSPLLVTLAA